MSSPLPLARQGNVPGRVNDDDRIRLRRQADPVHPLAEYDSPIFVYQAVDTCMAENNHPGKDAKGRFLTGHKYNNRPKKAPGDMIEMHPTIGYRDDKGRWLPGTCGPEASRFARLSELRQALQVTAQRFWHGAAASRRRFC